MGLGMVLLEGARGYLQGIRERQQREAEQQWQLQNALARMAEQVRQEELERQQLALQQAQYELSKQRAQQEAELQRARLELDKLAEARRAGAEIAEESRAEKQRKAELATRLISAGYQLLPYEPPQAGLIPTPGLPIPGIPVPLKGPPKPGKEDIVVELEGQKYILRPPSPTTKVPGTFSQLLPLLPYMAPDEVEDLKNRYPELAGDIEAYRRAAAAKLGVGVQESILRAVINSPYSSPQEKQQALDSLAIIYAQRGIPLGVGLPQSALPPGTQPVRVPSVVSPQIGGTVTIIPGYKGPAGPARVSVAPPFPLPPSYETRPLTPYQRAQLELARKREARIAAQRSRTPSPSNLSDLDSLDNRILATRARIASPRLSESEKRELRQQLRVLLDRREKMAAQLKQQGVSVPTLAPPPEEKSVRFKTSKPYKEIQYFVQAGVRDADIVRQVKALHPGWNEEAIRNAIADIRAGRAPLSGKAAKSGRGMEARLIIPPTLQEAMAYWVKANPRQSADEAVRQFKKVYPKLSDLVIREAFRRSKGK